MTIITKVPAPLTAALTDAQTGNYAVADAEVIRTIAGRNRALYEHAVGESGDGSTSPSVPVNPQGLYGHDHSGPPYGAALRHAVAQYGAAPVDAAHWDRPRVLDIGGTTNKQPRFSGWQWVRPYPPVDDTPYSRLQVTLRAAQTVTGTATVTIFCIVAGLPPTTLTAAVGGTQATYFVGTIDVFGGWNYMEFVMSSSNLTNPVTVQCFSLDQIQKLTH